MVNKDVDIMLPVCAACVGIRLFLSDRLECRHPAAATCAHHQKTPAAAGTSTSNHLVSRLSN